MLGIPAGFSKPIPIIYRRRRRRSGGDVTHASPATEASDRRPHSNGRHRVRAPRPGTVPTPTAVPAPAAVTSGARTGSASRLPLWRAGAPRRPAGNSIRIHSAGFQLKIMRDNGAWPKHFTSNHSSPIICAESNQPGRDASDTNTLHG